MPDTIQQEHTDFKSQTCSFPLVVVCDGIKTPENIGMLFRLGEAFGIKELILCGSSATPPNNKIRKTARSCDKRVKWTYYDKIETALEELINKSFKLIALELTNNSISLPKYNVNKTYPIALIIGSETHGISDIALKTSHISVEIPMYGNNSSMNVATATAIALYEITNQLL